MGLSTQIGIFLYDVACKLTAVDNAWCPMIQIVVHYCAAH
jgi:hypothetical protein